MKNPSFTIDFGPMFSGKTQELIRRCSKVTDAIASTYPEKSIEEVLFITDKNQSNRKVASSQGGITTHTFNFNPSPYLKIREVEELSEIKDEEIENVTLIGIDEGFYPDLYEKVLYWFLEKRISISLACIDGSYQQTNILPQVYDLIPYATKIFKHSAYCYKCIFSGRQENAYYTIKLDREKKKDKEYGGSEMYKPVCLTHLLEFRSSENEKL